jgi:hypothetical protein
VSSDEGPNLHLKRVALAVLALVAYSHAKHDLTEVYAEFAASYPHVWPHLQAMPDAAQTGIITIALIGMGSLVAGLGLTGLWLQAMFWPQTQRRYRKWLWQTIRRGLHKLFDNGGVL